MATNTGRRTYDTSTHIRSTRAKDMGRCTARIYSPCATDTGKQGELHLCRYLHVGIGLAVVHRCPQLLASLENSSAEQVRLPVFVATSNTVSSFRITSPYHHSLFCCSTKIISSIPSLSLNSLLGTLSFTLTSHIQLTILISACWSAGSV